MNNSRLIKRAAAVMAGVLLLVFAAVAVFVASFDVNRYKADIAQSVQARTGRTLSFDGNLALALFPSIGIKLPATTLSERGGHATFAQLASAQASVALLPLLRGQLEVDALSVDGLRATIERQADGRTNIDDLLAKPATSAPSSAKDAGATTKASASIGELRLRNADLTLRDLGAKRTVRLTAFDLHAGRYAPGARMPIEASANVVVDDPALAAKATIAAEFAWGDDGKLAGVHELELAADGRLNDRPLKLDARAERLLAAAEVLDIRELKVSLSRESDGGPVAVRLVAPRLSVSSQQTTAERIEFSAKRSGGSPLDLTLTIAELRGNATRLEAGTVRIAGNLRTGERRLAVDGVMPLVASVEQRKVSIERAVLNVVVDDPALAQKSIRLPLMVSATVDGRRETAALDLECRAEGLNGRARLDVEGFDARRVTFNVDAEQIDVDRYLPAERPASSSGTASVPSAPSPGRSVEADAKIDLSALRQASGSGSLRVARLKARGVEAAEVRLTATAADGRIDVSPLSARVYGGSVSGRIGIETRANRISAAGNVAGVQLGSAVGKIGGRAALEGSANGTFDLAAAGVTMKQMKRALSGSVTLDVRNGALVGLDLDDIIGSAGSFLQSRSSQSGVLDERKRTNFTQLTGSVRIKDGVALNDDLKAQSKTLALTGSGKMDLVAEQLDYTLRAQVSAIPSGSPNALRSLTGITIPVRLSGQPDHLRYSIDWTGVATEALVRRATGRRLGAPAVDQMMESLGGLLGGKKK